MSSNVGPRRLWSLAISTLALGAALAAPPAAIAAGTPSLTPLDALWKADEPAPANDCAKRCVISTPSTSSGQVCAAVVCDGKPTGGATITIGGQLCTTDATGQCCFKLGEGDHTITVNIPGCSPIIRPVKVKKDCKGKIEVVPIPLAGKTIQLSRADLYDFAGVYHVEGMDIEGGDPEAFDLTLAFTATSDPDVLRADVKNFYAIFPEAKGTFLTLPKVTSKLDPKMHSFFFFNRKLGRIWGEIWTRLDSSILEDGTRSRMSFGGTWDGGSHVEFDSASTTVEGGVSVRKILFGR
jgi:hypothetical protein